MGVGTVPREEPVGAQVGRDHLLDERLQLQVVLMDAARIMDPLDKGGPKPPVMYVELVDQPKLNNKPTGKGKSGLNDHRWIKNFRMSKHNTVRN